jgi:hypothetical protein
MAESLMESDKGVVEEVNNKQNVLENINRLKFGIYRY